MNYLWYYTRRRSSCRALYPGWRVLYLFRFMILSRTINYKQEELESSVQYFGVNYLIWKWEVSMAMSCLLLCQCYHKKYKSLKSKIPDYRYGRVRRWRHSLPVMSSSVQLERDIHWDKTDSRRDIGLLDKHSSVCFNLQSFRAQEVRFFLVWGSWAVGVTSAVQITVTVIVQYDEMKQVVVEILYFLYILNLLWSKFQSSLTKWIILYSKVWQFTTRTA